MYFLCLILYYYRIYITVMLNAGVVLLMLLIGLRGQCVSTLILLWCCMLYAVLVTAAMQQYQWSIAAVCSLALVKVVWQVLDICVCQMIANGGYCMKIRDQVKHLSRISQYVKHLGDMQMLEIIFYFLILFILIYDKRLYILLCLWIDQLNV